MYLSFHDQVRGGGTSHERTIREPIYDHGSDDYRRWALRLGLCSEGNTPLCCLNDRRRSWNCNRALKKSFGFRRGCSFELAFLRQYGLRLERLVGPP